MGEAVPVNPTYFRHGKRDTMLVSLAGPLANCALGFLSFFFLMIIGGGSFGNSPMDLLSAPQGTSLLVIFADRLLLSSIFINLALMPSISCPCPLDGSKILSAFIPPRHEPAYENFVMRGRRSSSFSSSPVYS